MKQKRGVYTLLLFFCLSCIIFSKPSNAASIKLNKTKKTIGVGDTYQLKVSGTKKEVKWSVKSSSIAKVSKTGKVTGKKIGTTTVTATIGKKKLTCKVTVHSHKYTKKVTKKATCTKKGVETYTCSCGKSYTKEIPKKEHVAGKYAVVQKATKTKDGLKVKKCIYCNKIMNKKTILSTDKQKEQDFVAKYLKDKKTKQVIIVKYEGGSNAALSFHQKGSDGIWSQVLSTYAYLGWNGINKQKEGDGKTPVGTFDIKSAFGIKANPGTSLPYTKVTDTMYWCGDRAYYNTLVDVSKVKHNCSGEHLKRYTGYYNYSMVIDYNSECVYGKGSAIFLHCAVKKNTGGCVAIPESKLITILKKAKPGIKIVIK